jgi:hypothetical protein
MNLGRREVTKLLLGATSGVVVLNLGSGCNYFPAESGDAYSPWNFPGTETRPEWLAAWAATLASNPHNTQPWTLHLTEASIDLHADPTRAPGSIDSLFREQHIGLGCALENLVVAANASGRATEVTLMPDPSDLTLVARVLLTPAPPNGDSTFALIAKRHTSRGVYSEAAPAAALEPGMQALVTEPGVRLHLFSSATDKSTFRNGTIDATVAFNADAQLSHDSNVWYRHTGAEILEHRDGLTIDATGNGASTRLFGKLFGRPTDATSNDYWLASTRGPQTTASAFCVLSSPASNARADQLRVGRVYQRLHLWAVGQGLAMQPLNQMAELQDREQTQGLAPKFTTVLNTLLATPDTRAQMLFRIGYAVDEALKSPRRPVDWVTV